MDTKNKSPYQKLIPIALAEDHVDRDITSIAIFENGGAVKTGYLIAKQNLVVSGLNVARDVFKTVAADLQFTFHQKDGNPVLKGTKLATASGSISDLLTAERVALNFLQHLSGIATLTQKFVQAIKPHRVRLLDTRKTTPGLRWLEKKAVRDGGGNNHRTSLADMYLIKDNHIEACGGISLAIQRVKEHQKKSQSKALIQTEARTIGEVKKALQLGVDLILLDNMRLSQIRKAICLAGNQCLLEVSGGVNLKNVKKMAATGVDRISIGALTHSAPAVDISFEIEN